MRMNTCASLLTAPRQNCGGAFEDSSEKTGPPSDTAVETDAWGEHKHALTQDSVRTGAFEDAGSRAKNVKKSFLFFF